MSVLRAEQSKRWSANQPDPHLSMRPARAEDKHALWHLYRNAMKPHVSAVWRWDENWQLTDFDAAFSASSTYLIKANEKLAGYVQLDLRRADNYVHMLVLAPAFRSSGIGARVLNEIVRVTHLDGRNIYLRVLPTNTAALRFYLREGWVLAAQEKTSYLLRHALNPTPAQPRISSRRGALQPAPRRHSTVRRRYLRSDLLLASD